MGVPKFNLKNVVCEYNNKNVKLWNEQNNY
jgi:hypothetical protein